MTPSSGEGIGELFGFVRRFVPEALLDGAGWEHLLDRIGDWPGSAIMSSVAGFEFRLWEAEPSADFIPSVWTSSALVDFFVEQGRAAPAGSREAALGAFLSRMSGDGWPASGLLEYDVVGVPRGERPDPGLFVNVGPYPQHAGMPPLGEVVGLLADALCLPRDDDELRAVEGACEALPPGAFAKSLGAMPGRERRAVRIQVDGISAGGVPGFLSRIDWAGPIQLVDDTLADMLAVATRFSLALDAAPHGPLPHIGLEMSPFTQGLGAFDEWLNSARGDWQPLIEHLVARDLCLPSKGEALLEFCGLDWLWGADGAPAFKVYRTIVGPKVVVSDDGVQTKAYVGMILFPAS